MDTNQARFVFEVQRVSDRVFAECHYLPEPSRPMITSQRTTSVRHTVALWLHQLATRLDIPEFQSV